MREIFKTNNNKIFSQKFFCYTIKVRKKVTKKIRWTILYGEVIYTFINGETPF